MSMITRLATCQPVVHDGAIGMRTTLRESCISSFVAGVWIVKSIAATSFDVDQHVTQELWKCVPDSTSLAELGARRAQVVYA